MPKQVARQPRFLVDDEGYPGGDQQQGSREIQPEDPAR